MKVKIESNEGISHLWSFENFKKEHNAKVVDFETNEGIINYIIYEINCEIKEDVPKSAKLIAEKCLENGFAITKNELKIP